MFRRVKEREEMRFTAGLIIYGYICGLRMSGHYVKKEFLAKRRVECFGEAEAEVSGEVKTFLRDARRVVYAWTRSVCVVIQIPRRSPVMGGFMISNGGFGEADICCGNYIRGSLEIPDNFTTRWPCSFCI